MLTKNPKHILISPLDWGLGHTTRCIPIIRHLLESGHSVTVAGNDAQRSFYLSTIPNLKVVPLDGYNITYSGWNRFAQAGILSQLPGILRTIRKEQHWLDNYLRHNPTDGIISDNRYGLYSQTVPSVILTHQLQVLSGFGPLADRAVQKAHYRFLGRFGRVWVVDNEGDSNLAGTLSHCRHLPPATNYIGLLSSYAAIQNVATPREEALSDAPILILLSGPEPQRTQLSNILWDQATQMQVPVIFVEGASIDMPRKEIPSHITYYQRLTYHELAPILRKASLVVCRSGYSTLMDLTALQKKAILIPTPGQTEQCYLAQKLQEAGCWFSAPQTGFSLSGALNACKTFPFRPLTLTSSFDTYKQVVDKWLRDL